jgi:hypothetical protein
MLENLQENCYFARDTLENFDDFADKSDINVIMP